MFFFFGALGTLFFFFTKEEVKRLRQAAYVVKEEHKRAVAFVVRRERQTEPAKAVFVGVGCVWGGGGVGGVGGGRGIGGAGMGERKGSDGMFLWRGERSERSEGHTIEQNGKGEASCGRAKGRARRARSVRGEARGGRVGPPSPVALRTPRSPSPSPVPALTFWSIPFVIFWVACGSPTATSFFPGNEIVHWSRGASGCRTPKYGRGGGGARGTRQQPDRKILLCMLMYVRTVVRV